MRHADRQKKKNRESKRQTDGQTDKYGERRTGNHATHQRITEVEEESNFHPLSPICFE